MNRAAKMLEVLRDGRPHSRRELFECCGFFLTNNAAAELREQGYDVRQERRRVNGDNVYFYSLASLSDGAGTDGAPTDSPGRESAPSLSEASEGLTASPLQAAARPHRRDGGRPVQVSLLDDEPLWAVGGNKPEWA